MRFPNFTIRLAEADRQQLERIERKLDLLITMERLVTPAIAGFQTTMNTLATQLGSEFDQIASEEQALKQKITDLQAKVDAGGQLSAEDAAALQAVEDEYAALVTKAQGLIAPPAASAQPVA